MIRILTLFLAACLLGSCAAPPPFILSIIGTNDVHGELIQKPDRGGLVTVSGYVNAVRKARENDGGAVLLIDAGDMWQGTLESNLTEGESIVAAYNAMGYTAAAVGNHEFDFGPAGPAPIPHSDTDDPRGALKQRASEASFPFLAANLIDQSTGEPVAWDNFQPSVLVDVKNVKIGIVGVMTRNALTSAIAANTTGLAIAPLAETIESEARALRDAGATIIIVTAHAGGKCLEFNDPHDTSSCDLGREIFRVAEALPGGLVDHIFAGHEHDGIAHFVNGISITTSYSRTQALSRVDLTIDRSTGTISSKKVYPPIPLLQVTRYEGIDVEPDPAVVAIADQAIEFTAAIKQEKIGIRLATPFVRTESPESALGNLYTDALLASVDADISIHTINSSIRADLPAGELTFGSVYEMSPFDNQIVVIELSGSELRQVISEQAHEQKSRIGFSGMRVSAACTGTKMTVDMRLTNGRGILDSDTIKVVVVNYLALGGNRVFESVMPDGGYELQLDAPFARDVIIGWLQQKGGTINASEFQSDDNPKWTLPASLDRRCRLGT